jgi:hypothetical protein
MNGGTVLLAASSSSHLRHLVLRAADYLAPPDNGVAPNMPHDGDVQLAANGCAVLSGALQLTPSAARDLWVALKDGLAFPSLLAVHAEAGLPPPAGLLALPEDLKQAILRALGVRLFCSSASWWFARLLRMACAQQA